MLVYMCLEHSNWKECPINAVSLAVSLCPEQTLPGQKHKPGRKIKITIIIIIRKPKKLCSKKLGEPLANSQQWQAPTAAPADV